MCAIIHFSFDDIDIIECDDSYSVNKSQFTCALLDA